MTTGCESLVTKPELKKELARYPSASEIQGVVSLGLLEVNRRLADKANASDLAKRIIEVERKIADPVAKANAAAKAAEEAKRKAASVAGELTKIAGESQSTAGKLARLASNVITLATTVGTIYNFLQGLVNEEKFRALENSFTWFQQVYDAQTASFQRIIKEVRTIATNASNLAGLADKRAVGAINTVEALRKQMGALEFDVALTLKDIKKQSQDVQNKVKNYDTEIAVLKQGLSDKASQQALKDLEAKINAKVTTAVGKNYDPQIQRLEDGLKAANDQINQANKTIQEQNTQIRNLGVQVEDLRGQIDPNQPRIIGAPKIIDWGQATYRWWDYTKQVWHAVPIGQTPSGSPQGNGFFGQFVPVTTPNIVTTTSGGTAGGSPIPQLQTQTETLTKAVTATQTKVDQLEKGLASLGGKVGTPPPIPAPTPAPTPVPTPAPAPVPNYQPQIDTLRQQMADLIKQVAGIPIVNMPQINSSFNQLNNSVNSIASNINSNIAPAVREVNRNTQPRSIVAAAGEAVCRESGGNGCLGGRLGNIERRGDSLGDMLGRLFPLLFDGFNAVANTSQLQQLGRIEGQLGRIEAQNVETHTRLGDRIVGGISGWARRLNQQFGISRWLELLQTAFLLHNAMMLSNSIITSLGYVVDNILNIAGFQFQDAEGTNISFTGLVNSTVEGLIRNVIGDTTYEEIRGTWLAWNRVIQTAANLYSNVRNIFDTARDMMETITENSGKVGNALKRYLVVPFNAYGWMPERNYHGNRITRGIDKYVQGANATREVFDSVGEVTEGVVEIQETAQEIKESKEEAKKAIEDFRKETDDKENQVNEDSKPPEIDFKDLLKKEPEDN